MSEDARQIRAIENLAEHLKTLHRDGFYGSITINFKSGYLGLIRQERTFLPELLPLNGKTVEEEPHV